MSVLLATSCYGYYRTYTGFYHLDASTIEDPPETAEWIAALEDRLRDLGFEQGPWGRPGMWRKNRGSQHVPEQHRGPGAGAQVSVSVWEDGSGITIRDFDYPGQTQFTWEVKRRIKAVLLEFGFPEPEFKRQQDMLPFL